jgi:hypothetical protein
MGEGVHAEDSYLGECFKEILCSFFLLLEGNTESWRPLLLAV